jgi:hypothetical protein
MSATACATHGGHAQYESYCLGLRSGPGANRLSCWELTFGAKFRATQVAVFALGILPIALGALYFTKGPVWLPVIVFVILYGASNGIMTIARGLIPAEVFGLEPYGAVNGALSAPVLASRAAGTIVASLVSSATGGYDAVVLTLIAIAVLSVLAFRLH